MSQINNGGPAFPVSTRPMGTEEGYGHQDGATTWQYGVMTLRDYFAAQALTGFLHNTDRRSLVDIQEVTHSAYKLADAMLKAREA